ncbi:MAG: anthranilate phosphoribosyltransferase, partial [bacterium]|nr:anthranilate phosphoribosyltransferase [bacterium]
NLSAFLIALKAKGEDVEEITGAAQGMLNSVQFFECPNYEFVDLVGTGGDNVGTINISTAAAFVVAELGLPVAKHGNVSVSSKCGSADVLKALGANLNLSPARSRECLDKVGFCFLYAPDYHQGMRYAMPVRKELKLRTIFNLLGPLVNPARPTCQLTGVYREDLCLPIARVLQKLGLAKGLVVFGCGLDEVALHGPTTAARILNGTIESLIITPEMAGVKSYPLGAILGGNPTQNALTLQNILQGQGDEAHVAAVAINAGALVWANGGEKTLKSATQAALSVLSTNKAFLRLEKFVEITNK